MDPNWSQESSRMAPRGPKMAQRGPKTAPERPQDGPKRAQDEAEMALKGPIEHNQKYANKHCLFYVF